MKDVSVPLSGSAVPGSLPWCPEPGGRQNIADDLTSEIHSMWNSAGILPEQLSRTCLRTPAICAERHHGHRCEKPRQTPCPPPFPPFRALAQSSRNRPTRRPTFTIRRALRCVGMHGELVHVLGWRERPPHHPVQRNRERDQRRRYADDLAGMSDSRDGSQNALRLVHARAVVSLDALQIQLDESRGRDPDPDRVLRNRRLFQMKFRARCLGALITTLLGASPPRCVVLQC
jgi:hypothetical protein